MPFSVGIQGQRNGEIPVIFLWFIQSPALRDMPLRAVEPKRAGEGDRPLVLTDQIILSQQGVKIMPTTLIEIILRIPTS